MKNLFFIAVLIALVTSCSRNLGYSVVLWSIPERNIYDGDIVQVHIKSNINKVYVVNTMDNKEKFEIPQWQISTPASKHKTQETVKQMEEYRHIYARTKLDGLPVRFEAVNTSRQVYRLRKNEMIKIIKKGEHETITSGRRTFDGNWFRILTNEGATGWCFSYNLDLFDETKEQLAVQESLSQDEIGLELFDKTWVPDFYQSMITNNRIDLTELKKNYSFDMGITTKTVKLTTKDIVLSYPYEGFEEIQKDIYTLKGTPLTVMVRGENTISVQYVDEKGMPIAFTFVNPTESIDKVITNEQNRRNELYARILNAGNYFISTNYGDLQFFGDKTFLWEGYSALIPTLIPKTALGKGRVDFKLHLQDNLANTYDGVITFEFDNADKDVHFLYRIEQHGIRLESIDGSTVRNNIIVDKNISSLVIFFENVN
ncbi:MAG: SH3 domain-containing protein [Treponemataceae bacterium]